jgi:adenosylhomocysteine nucleosidase
MPRLAIVAALEREVSALIEGCRRVQQDYEGRTFIFFERDDTVAVCGGIGADAARRAAEAVIALYRPALIQSVGFAGALTASMTVAEIFTPAVVVDARDGSRVEIDGGIGTLVTFMEVASAAQKSNLAQAYGAQAVDMEAAAVAAAARAHGIQFAAIKVISDELTFELPHTARFIDAQGRFRTASFARFAALRPWLWPRVATLASNSRKASQALGQHLERSQKDSIPSAPQPAATTAFTSRSPK